MIFKVRWLDEASQTVRLARGSSEDGNALGSVERATIGDDGSVGAFQPAGISLVTPRLVPAIAVTGAFVYVIGFAVLFAMVHMRRESRKLETSLVLE